MNLNIDSFNHAFLSNLDSPGTYLIGIKFNCSNYLGWSRNIRLALGVKAKLGLINGMCIKLVDNQKEIEKWSRCDCMIHCWLLNSMTKELVEAFMYANSSRELWFDVYECFGMTNGPLLYQIQHELLNVKQGGNSNIVFFNRIKKLWD